MLKNILKKTKKLFKKLKINKITKICVYILLILGLFLLLLEFTLRYFLPLPSVKTKILDRVSQVIGAQLKAGDISAGLLWIEIDNITLDTDKNNLITFKSLKVRQNFLKLLAGQVSLKHIYINEPIIQIIRYKDGTFNFDPLLSPQETNPKSNTENSETSGVPLDLRIKTLDLNNGTIIYLDLKDDTKATINNFNLSLHNFSFYEPFTFNLAFSPYFKQKDFTLDNIRLALSAEADLKKLNLSESYLQIKQFVINYKDVLLKAKATINNFDLPKTDFDIKLENLSNEALKPFANTPEFALPLLEAKGNFNYLIEKQNIKLNNLTLALPDQNTQLDLSGNFHFENDLKAKGKLTFKSVLDSFGDISPLIKEYQPEGKISADFDFAWPLELSGKLDLEDIGFFTDKAGTFKDINTTVKLNNINDIKMEELKGIINKNPFTAKATYQKKKTYADVFFDFKTDKLYLIDTSEKKEETSSLSTEGQTQTPQPTKTAQNSSNFFVPININAKVDIAKFDIPYIKGNKLLFTAKAKNITPQLDQVHGLFDISMEDGQIKDVYTLADANALTKVMFMSLGIVSKVINTLNVLDLLGAIGKVVVGDNQETEDDEILQNQKINGKLDFDSFNTTVDFDDGLATMNKCSFVSSLFSFRVNGNINFNDRKIKLNVDSAPGKHTQDGIMPLNIDIKGTVEEPKGSLSVISSVSSLITDTVKNNPVSNILKSTWGMLFSSDKKEEEKATSEQETQEDDPKPEQEPKENQE